jgi:hypothetical protein
VAAGRRYLVTCLWTDGKYLGQQAKIKNNEPQNTEQGIMNVEGKENSSFEIPCSMFDIQVA